MDSLINKIGSSIVSREGRYSGMLYASLGFIFYAFTNFFFERIREINVIQMLSFSGAVIVCCNVVTCDALKENIVTKKSGTNRFLITRGILGWIWSFTIYFTITKLPLSDASVLLMVTPACAAILGYIFLKEPFGWWEVFALFLCFAGIICIYRPASIFGMTDEENAKYHTSDRIIGVISGISQGICGGFVQVLVRYLG